jgi:hypothetical protein
MRTGSRLPVVVVAGLHAEARHEAVELLLRAVPDSMALHHDLSEAARGAVRRTVRDAGGLRDSEEVPLVNDCACCALREDLVPELERMAAGDLVSLAVVELWDSVEPKSMAEVIVGYGGDRLELGNVLTVVDPALVLPCLANGDDLAEAGLAAAAGGIEKASSSFRTAKAMRFTFTRCMGPMLSLVILPAMAPQPMTAYSMPAA